MKFRQFSLLLILCLFLGCSNDELQTKNIEDENKLIHKAYQLESHKLTDIFSFFIDTTYGSSTYSNINTNSKFTVLKTQTGLIIREENH